MRHQLEESGTRALRVLWRERSMVVPLPLSELIGGLGRAATHRVDDDPGSGGVPGGVTASDMDALVQAGLAELLYPDIDALADEMTAARAASAAPPRYDTRDARTIVDAHQLGVRCRLTPVGELLYERLHAHA